MRQLIKNAIAPIWLTYLVAGLLTAFPIAAQLLTTALFIPLALILIGIVLRGSTFVFLSFSSNALRPIWERTFSAASIITPFLFGTMAAAVASGALQIVHGQMPIGLVGAWLTPFAITVGLMGVALCATTSAVYLTVEAERRNQQGLMESFRWRALSLGLVGIALTPSEAPILWQGILDHALWAVVVTVLLGLAAGACLVFRRFRLSRIL